MTGIDIQRLQVRLAELEDKLNHWDLLERCIFRIDKLEDVVYDLNQKIVELENLIERKSDESRRNAERTA